VEFRNDEDQLGVSFRQIRLPRSMRVEYPRDPWELTEDWPNGGSLLVACDKEENRVGYINLQKGFALGTIQVTDLVALRRLRRQGIGTALLLAAQAWGAEHDGHRLVLEMQSKNYPAICLAGKLGYEFSGYRDRYYPNQDIALFFTRQI
jgi:ribosomal protein S18 acetylase RimI-like enzyme